MDFRKIKHMLYTVYLLTVTYTMQVTDHNNKCIYFKTKTHT